MTEYVSASSSLNGFSRLPIGVRRILMAPFLVMGSMLAISMALSIISFHLALSLLALSYIYAAYYVERRHLNSLIFPPLVLFALSGFYAGSLGPLMIAEDIFSRDVDSILLTHMVSVSTFPLLLLVYWRINRKTPPFDVSGRIWKDKTFNDRLYFVASALVAFTVALHYIQIHTGQADRGHAGDFLVDTPFGSWSYFDAFSKLQYVAYMLLPYLYRASGKIVRGALASLFVLYLLFEAANSSRGAVVFPLVFLVAGYWLIGGSFRRVMLSLLLLVVGAFTIIPVFHAFRGSGALESTEQRDLGARLGLLRDVVSQSFDSGLKLENDSKGVIGRALLGNVDYLVYSYTPEIIPFSGWERFGDLLYLWVPSMFFPAKPQLLDANLISSVYTGVFHLRSTVGISFQADLYRRFGWWGVFWGYLVFSLLASLCARYALRASSRDSALWGIGIVLFISIFIRGTPSGSVLGMIWNFFYDYPKYLLALGILVYLSRHVVLPRFR